ncbi:MAG: hypothetical protein R3C09_23045 [Pirellulaceae bacterium]
MSNHSSCPLALIVLFVATSSTSAQEPANFTTNARQTVTAKNFKQILFADEPEITLMSHNGEWEGSDNDLEFKLRRDGTLVITDFGYTVITERGRYKVNNDGTIVITPSGRTPWLAMPLAIENGKLVIRPPAKEVLFEAARNVGIPESELTDDAYRDEYERWPLLQIDRKKAGVTKR